MNLYEIEVIETLKRVVSEKANSYDEARNAVEEKYNNEDIVLDYEDCIGTDFKPHNEQLIKDNFKVIVEYDKETEVLTFLQNSDSKKYFCKNNQVLKEVIQSYFDKNIELEDIEKSKNKEKEREER